MHEVRVSYEVRPSREAIVSNLSPEAIVEYAEIYDVRSREETDRGTEITVSFESAELTFEFTETAHGYEYAVVEGSDLFATRYSRITVDEDENTRISATTRYTIDSIWSFVLDRLAADTVQEELETTIENLVDEAA